VERAVAVDSKTVLVRTLDAIVAEKNQRRIEDVIMKGDLMKCTHLTRRDRCCRAMITWVFIDSLLSRDVGLSPRSALSGSSLRMQHVAATGINFDDKQTPSR
jgi:hypothetical protein